MASPDFIEKGIKGIDQASVGPMSQWVDTMPQYARRLELREVGAVTTIYKAWAAYGTAESSDGWLIVRLILDETNGLDLDEGIAGGAAGDFSYSWTNRASHSYS